MKRIFTLLSLSCLSVVAFGQTTVKKVILEDFTGTWCGWCPEGTVIIEGLAAANPTTLIPVASHNGDGLQIADGAAIDAGLNVTAYPNGAIDRFQFSGETKIPVSRSKWSNYFSTRLSTPAIASISISDAAYSGGTYSGTVKIKFNTAPTASVPIAVNVYLLEDSIPATGSLAQGNYSSAVQGGADPLTNWYHNATLRQALGTAWGWTTVVPSTVTVGDEYTKSFSFTVPGTWVAKNVKVAAFVAYNGTAASNQKEIINADQLPLKFFNPTATTDLNKNPLQVMVYPNPAKCNSLIYSSFNLQKDATVKMEVMNSLGQLMDTPYESFEISGAHTIQWKLANQDLPKGTYFIRLSTDKGDMQVTKLLVE